MIPLQFALRRRMMMAGGRRCAHIGFTAGYVDKCRHGRWSGYT